MHSSSPKTSKDNKWFAGGELHRDVANGVVGVVVVFDGQDGCERVWQRSAWFARGAVQVRSGPAAAHASTEGAWQEAGRES